jgi:hypothetical protein
LRPRNKREEVVLLDESTGERAVSNQQTCKNAGCSPQSAF